MINPSASIHSNQLPKQLIQKSLLSCFGSFSVRVQHVAPTIGGELCVVAVMLLQWTPAYMLVCFRQTVERTLTNCVVAHLAFSLGGWYATGLWLMVYGIGFDL